jgi:hypothetical protein
MPRPRGRVFPREAGVQQPRTRQRPRVGRFAHLVNAELPLHEGDDSPVVQVREDQGRPQPGIQQVLQRIQKRIQPRLVRGGGHTVVPGVDLLLQHLAGVGGRPTPSLRR